MVKRKKSEVKRVLVSACLLGIECNYKGKSKKSRCVLNLLKRRDVILIPICPEQLGGLPTPREAAEIVGGDGFDVLRGKARVFTKSGEDVTRYFIRGAKLVGKMAKLLKVKYAILKQRSPSCGCGQIYDGSFTGKVIEGYGVTAALLKKMEIRVISDEDFEDDFLEGC